MTIDDQLLAEAQRITGVSEKTALVREGLRALIERESARRFGAVGRQRATIAANIPKTPRSRMMLVDTSVWIDHLRVGDEELAALLNKTQVLTHPFVVGEPGRVHFMHRDNVGVGNQTSMMK